MTRSGRAFLRPTSGLRTFGAASGSSAIPTPTAGDAKSSGSRNLEGSKAHPGVSLTDYVTAGNSSTPRRMWPTPTVSDSKGPSPGLQREGSQNLAEWVVWPTPKSSPSGPDYARTNRPESGGDDLATAVARRSPGQLNPTFVEWLMGFPLGWTDLGRWATRSSRRSHSGSDSSSSSERKD